MSAAENTRRLHDDFSDKGPFEQGAVAAAGVGEFDDGVDDALHFVSSLMDEADSEIVSRESPFESGEDGESLFAEQESEDGGVLGAEDGHEDAAPAPREFWLTVSDVFLRAMYGDISWVDTPKKERQIYHHVTLVENGAFYKVAPEREVVSFTKDEIECLMTEFENSFVVDSRDFFGPRPCLFDVDFYNGSDFRASDFLVWCDEQRLMGSHFDDTIQECVAAFLNQVAAAVRHEKSAKEKKQKSLETGRHFLIVTPHDIQALSVDEYSEKGPLGKTYAYAEVFMNPTEGYLLAPAEESVNVTTSIEDIVEAVGANRFIIFNAAQLEAINGVLEAKGRVGLREEQAVFLADRAVAIGETTCHNVYELGHQGSAGLDMPESPSQATPKFTIRFIAQIMSFILGIEDTKRLFDTSSVAEIEDIVVQTPAATPAANKEDDDVELEDLPVFVGADLSNPDNLGRCLTTDIDPPQGWLVVPLAVMNMLMEQDLPFADDDHVVLYRIAWSADEKITLVPGASIACHVLTALRLLADKPVVLTMPMTEWPNAPSLFKGRGEKNEYFPESMKSVLGRCSDFLLSPSCDVTVSSWLSCFKTCQKYLDVSLVDHFPLAYAGYAPPRKTRLHTVLAVDETAPEVPDGKGDADKDFRTERSRLFRRQLEGTLPLGGLVAAKMAEVIETLREEFPWFSGLTNEIESALALRLGNEDAVFRLPPLLLYGPPGVGKTRYARRLGELFNVGFEMFDCGGVHDSIGFRGSLRTYGGAEASFLAKSFLRTQSANPVLLLDELDKIGTSNHNGSLHSALLGALETSTAMAFKDDFLDATLDARWVSWIATANDSSKLPDYLKSRMLAVCVPSPSGQHVKAILAGVTKDLENEHELPPGSLRRALEGELESLTDVLERTGSVRLFKAEVRRLCVEKNHPRPVKKLAPLTTEEHKTAVHEAGHAALDYFGDCPVGIVRASVEIDAESASLGHVLFQARRNVTARSLKAALAMSLGGRAAEEHFFGIEGLSAGARSDIAHAGDTAKRFVTEFGMSKLGILPKIESEHMRAEVDREAAALLAEAMATARRLVKRRAKSIKALALAFEDKRTLSGVEVEAVFKKSSKRGFWPFY